MPARLVLLAFVVLAFLALGGCTTAFSLSGLESQPIWHDEHGGHLPPSAGPLSMSQ
jgi:hypothetical protein